MDNKSALGNKKKEETPSSSKSTNAAPIIIIFVFIAIVAAVVLIFKDKIFKKKQKTKNLESDIPKDEPEPETPIEPETLDPDSEESRAIIERMELPDNVK